MYKRQEQAFLEYARLVPEEGWCLGWGDDARVRRVLGQLSCHTRTYGLEPFNELRAEQIQYDELGRAYFVATLFGHPLCEVQLAVPGEHNLLNALAVIGAAEISCLPMQRVAEILGRFTGAHRRFELTGIVDGVKLYNDYGHNPTEMKNAIHIAKLQPHKTLWAVWQPHTYSPVSYTHLYCASRCGCPRCPWPARAACPRAGRCRHTPPPGGSSLPYTSS